MSTTSRYHAWSTVAAIASAALVSAAGPAPVLGALTIPLIALTWFVFRSTATSPVPRWLINAMVIAASLNLARQLLAPGHRVEDSIARLSEFLVVLLTIKMLEHRRIRDQMQAIALSGMAAIGATMTSVTLGVAMLTAVYLVAALNTIVLFQFVGNEARARGSRDLWASTTEKGPDERWLVPLRWTMVAALPALCAGTVVVFLAMPRDLAKNLLGSWNAKSGLAATGFADEVQLGFSGVITESDDIVMEITLEIDGRTRILTDPQYFRGAVLDHYDPERGRWQRSATAAELDRLRRPSTAIFSDSNAVLEAPGMIVQRVNIRSRKTDHLFALLTPIRGQTRADGRITPNLIDGTVRLDRVRGAVRYEVASDPMAIETRITSRDRDDEFFLEGPVHDFAAEVLRRRRLERDPEPFTDSDDDRRVEVFRQHLATAFQYTLETEAPPKDMDPIEWFLLEGHRGTCEYFASALAAMCRSVGIEARVVTGYVTNEVDETSGQYIVRSRHAHAWVEALVPVPSTPPDADAADPLPLRWRTFDATPVASASRTMGVTGNLWARMRRMMERLESAWLNAVVAFDGSRQVEVLGPSMGPAGWVGDLAERFARVRGNAASRLVTTAAAFATGFALAAGSLVVVRWWLVRRRRARSAVAPTAASPTHNRASARALARLDRTVRRGGIPRPVWVGAVDHAAAIAQQHPSAGAIADRIARACYAVRFGATDPQSLSAMRSDLRDLASELAAHKRGRTRAR